jgi:hypothetical protein
MFHLYCLQRSIAMGYEARSGPKVNFAHASCPTCRTFLAHASLEEALRPVRLMKRQVEAKKLARMNARLEVKEAAKAAKKAASAAAKAAAKEAPAKKASKASKAKTPVPTSVEEIEEEGLV